jgi:hypothetical protein
MQEKKHAMSKQKEADLILKLYELRREPIMRDARNWFFSFNPTSVQDFVDVMIHEKNSAYYRMVVSYWEMAASLVTNGAIDAQLFNDANGEHVFVYSKIEPFIPQLQAAFNIPEYLPNFQKVVKDIPDIEQKIAGIRERMTQFASLREQHAKAQAAGAEV